MGRLDLKFTTGMLERGRKIMYHPLERVQKKNIQFAVFFYIE